MKLNTCAVLLAALVAGAGCRKSGDPFPQPFKTITVPSFSITHLQCQDLLGTSSAFVEEKVQLNLTKP